jgi:ATP-dependent Lon protease
VKWIDEVLDLALERALGPKKPGGGEGVAVPRAKGKGKAKESPSVTH